MPGTGRRCYGFAAIAGLFSLLGMLLVCAVATGSRVHHAQILGLVIWMIGDHLCGGLSCNGHLEQQACSAMVGAGQFCVLAMLVMAYAVSGSIQEYMKMQKITVAGAILWYALLSVWGMLIMKSYLAEFDFTPEERETAEEASQYEFQIRHRGS